MNIVLKIIKNLIVTYNKSYTASHWWFKSWEHNDLQLPARSSPCCLLSHDWLLFAAMIIVSIILILSFFLRCHHIIHHYIGLSPCIYGSSSPFRRSSVRNKSVSKRGGIIMENFNLNFNFWGYWMEVIKIALFYFQILICS